MKVKHFLIAMFAFSMLLSLSCTDDTSTNSSSGYPSFPMNPIPENGATNQARTGVLSWTCYDLDSDTLTYDIFLGTTFPPPLIESGYTTQMYYPDILNFESTYYWKIIVRDNDGHVALSPPWSFSTRTDEVIQFPDSGLNASVRRAINKPDGDIYISDVDTLTFLDAQSANISDLSGMEYLTGLTILFLGFNQIRDVSLLSNLSALTALSLEVNPISDLSPLSDLTTLTYLDLNYSTIEDLSPISSLTSLTNLSLFFNRISDVSPLSGLTALTHLYLIFNNIEDISPLSSLTSLHILNLAVNEVSDISPLVENPGINEGDYVDLGENPLSETSINIYIPELESRGVTVYY